MAIIKTKPFLIVGVLKNKEQILQKIQSFNCSQIEEIKNFEKIELDEKIDQINKLKLKTKKVISILLKTLDLKDQKKFNIKKIKNISELFSCKEKTEKICQTIDLILDCNEKIINSKKNIQKNIDYEEKLKEYLKINIPLKNIKTKNTTMLVGDIAGCYFEKELQLKFKEIEDNIFFKIVSTTKYKTTIFLTITNNSLEKAKKILSDFSFSEIKIKTNKPPKEEILKAEEEIKNLKEKVLKAEKEIKNNNKDITEIMVFSDYLDCEKEKYETIKKATKTKNTFILKGFLNPQMEEKFKKTISEDFNSYVKIFESSKNCPVFFKNNLFSAPVEQITKTYSMPCSQDVDPNPIMSFFYYMFFGMMFSDAGYGLILTLACSVFLVSSKIAEEKKNTFKMFFFCGISTTIFGFLYGSFFGDFVYTFSKTFLNKNISLAPIWINTTQSPLTLLIFSIVVGIIQVVVGLLIKFYILTKQKKFKEALFCVLNWVLILIAIGILLTNTMLKIKNLNPVGKILLIFGIIMTMIFSGFESKGIMKFLKGIINLYGITSYISDILSYSRLMALGIATGVIANVVNILASMKGNSLLGTILFVFVFLLGHTLNFSINILGAYVHTNRLQYVEFFSKFYTGGGRSFSPFGLHTKYFKFSKKLK